jgi:transcriptional regulator with XRE-family HTH domain
MAERLGWSQDTYNHYEYGRRAPQIDRLAAIADVLGVPLAALLTEDERVAAIMVQLAHSPDLVGEVAFFLKSLEQEMPASDESTLDMT